MLQPNRKSPSADTDIYKTILEDALAGYWDWNIVENTEYLSPAFKAMLGYSEEDMANSTESWQNLIFKEDMPKLLKNLEDHFSSKGSIPYKGEIRFRHKNGNTVWIVYTGRVIEWSIDDNPVRMVGSHMDITTQKEHEHRLKISETRFKGAFEFSAIGMALVSTEGKWLKVNRSLCELIGYSEHQLLQTTFQDITHPDDLDLDLRNLTMVLAGELETYQMEKRYFHKDGQIIWVLLSVSLVKTPDGEPVHFVSQIENITQRKKNEIEQRELTKKLQRQNRQLADFAQITSHNLRAPVSNLSSLLMMHEKIKEPEQKAGLFEKFKTVINHLSDTLNDLVNSLQVTQNPDVQREQVYFKDTADKVCQMLAGEIIESKAYITFDFENAPVVTYNRSYLESIMLNLISNSLKYRSEKRALKIELKTWICPNGEQHLSVTDNGLGINMKLQERKLFGLHKTFHRNLDSKGVGLFMTNAQIQAQGGEIKATSEVDKGTTFIVTFNKVSE